MALDDRVYPRDALETYLYYSELLPEAALCFRGAAMPRSLGWRDVFWSRIPKHSSKVRLA